MKISRNLSCPCGSGRRGKRSQPPTRTRLRMSEAHRHHYISQFYLRNFVADRSSPRLFVVDLPGRKTFTTSPSNVALENDFHTITTPGHEPDTVEKRLSKFESDVAPALARVIESASLGNGRMRSSSYSSRRSFS